MTLISLILNIFEAIQALEFSFFCDASSCSYNHMHLNLLTLTQPHAFVG